MASNSYRLQGPPTLLPPRRPSSMPLPPQRSILPHPRDATITNDGTSSIALHRSGRGNLSRPESGRSIPINEPSQDMLQGHDGLARSNDQHLMQATNPSARWPRLQALRDLEHGVDMTGTSVMRPRALLRASSLRIQSKASEERDERPRPLASVLGHSSSVPSFTSEQMRPHSHPPSSRQAQAYGSNQAAPGTPLTIVEVESQCDDVWQLPRIFPDSNGIRAPPLVLTPRPRPSLHRLSSLDNLISYREEKLEWKRASSLLHQRMEAMRASEPSEKCWAEQDHITSFDMPVTDIGLSTDGNNTPKTPQHGGKFRHFVAEIGFCFTIAMTQFLAEYLISGFALELPRLFSTQLQMGSGSLGLFWPASLLSLILSATLLFFARVSDLYGGYPPFMFGIVLLTIWTLIPGFVMMPVVIDLCRAMQGLALAALTPSTFAMIGSIYSEGPRKNMVMGMYSGCAPLGFFAGFLTAGALPTSKPQWYFWIAAALSGVTAVTAYLTVPHDKTDRKKLGLKMDWIGAFLITAGLILVSYALAVEPYAGNGLSGTHGFASATVLGPLISGLVCLAFAIRFEGWVAHCPLLPFDFFKPKSVVALCLAGLCFYASYGVWLYSSAEFFHSPTNTTRPDIIEGVTLALWYTPTAVGGILLCVVGGALVHIVPIQLLLLVSGLAWIGAPLLLAVSPLPLNYWAAVMPSMLCATLGIDLTFTVSIIFLSSVQPLKYQGLSGAVCSILVNLAMSFSLPLSEIVMKKAESSIMPQLGALSPIEQIAAADHLTNWGYQATFIYAAGSAGLGFVISVLFVRISRSVAWKQSNDTEALALQS